MCTQTQDSIIRRPERRCVWCLPVCVHTYSHLYILQYGWWEAREARRRRWWRVQCQEEERVPQGEKGAETHRRRGAALCFSLLSVPFSTSVFGSVSIRVDLCSCVYVCTCVWICVSVSVPISLLYLCVCVCVCVSACTCVCTNERLSLCLCVRMCVRCSASTKT